MTALGFRDIGDMPGLSGPDTRHSDWLRTCEGYARSHAPELARRCLADSDWLEVLASEAHVVGETDNLKAAIADPCDYGMKVAAAVRRIAFDRAYEHLLHEATEHDHFADPADVQLVRVVDGRRELNV